MTTSHDDRSTTRPVCDFCGSGDGYIVENCPICGGDPKGLHPSSWPTGSEMIRQIREALGLFGGAMPRSPQDVWEETLNTARALRSRSAPDG